MNNEQEQLEQPQQATPVVTPPPFRHSEEHTEVQDTSASPTLEDRIAQLALDEDLSKRLTELTDGLPASSLSTEVLTTLVRGLTHDDDVKNADAAGFLRGRNEKIETMMHQRPDNDVEAESTPVFPQYCRRSIWDR